uniref:Uncharacterized protein n=1 Tax=viral metagenome TaxID=1070528 RepID=A0A6M3IHM8_9ZZZZ
MGKKAYNDQVRTTNANAYRNCRDVFLNKLDSQALAIADFTDEAGTALGHIDFDTDLPANAIVVGWKAVVSEGFAGDTTAVAQVGISGDVNKYSGVVTPSVLAAGTVGALGNTDSELATTAQTPRVTVTGGADFTTIVTAANGAMVVSLYYFLAN